ncbi:MAG TPA: hypothetical protein VFF98_14910 [Novosphingobium sp.]|nr:hypothetical protein [Novosphingobium sp.]HZV08745.1 hypothetical protein [Novosphingobium sp.]
MRVVSVPGRLVRHPVTRRVIDERGVLVDPHDVTFARLVADGDLAVAEDDEVPEVADAAPGASPAISADASAGTSAAGAAGAGE